MCHYSVTLSTPGKHNIFLYITPVWYEPASLLYNSFMVEAAFLNDIGSGHLPALDFNEQTSTLHSHLIDM